MQHDPTPCPERVDHDAIAARLRADLEYWQASSADAARDVDDCDYGEADVARAYADGRVAALTDVMAMLGGTPVELFSETEA